MNSRLRAFYGFEPFCLQKRGTVAAIISFVGDGLDRPASYEINIGFSTPGRP